VYPFVLRSLFTRISLWYRKMGIQMVISVSFTVVAVVGMVFMGLSLFWRFSAATEQMQQESSQRVLTQVNINLDSYLRRMMRVSDAMYYRAIKNADLAEDSLFEEMALLYEENRDSLVSIALFDSSGVLVSATPLSVLKSSASPREEDWFQLALGRMENLHFSSPHVQNLFDDPDYTFRWVVSLSRQVELNRAGRTEDGVLLVDMSFSGVEQIFRETNLPNGGYIYLIDSEGEIIYHPSQQLIYAGLLEENNFVAAGYRDGTCREEFSGSRRQVTVKTVGYTGWRLVAVVPVESIVQNSQQIILFGISLLFFSIFFMSFLNFRISGHISDPIRQLEKSIQELEAGKENVEFSEGGSYEVKQLSRSIRSMVSTLRHLSDDIIEQEKQKRLLELSVLQSQINPHFLYNTLDSVIWLTEAGQYEEAVQMVTSLGRLFRIALSRGNNIIPLRDELEHARHYMAIQSIRYKNRFTTRITADPNTEGLYTLKLVVQPLLENAIYHGVTPGEEDGQISLHARREGGRLLIDISDNGPGIPPQRVEALLDDSRPQAVGKGSGLGVRNIHHRIALTFGGEYGLTFFSEPDEGTLVRITLPAIGEEEARRYGEENAP